MCLRFIILPLKALLSGFLPFFYFFFLNELLYALQLTSISHLYPFLLVRLRQFKNHLQLFIRLLLGLFLTVWLALLQASTPHNRWNMRNFDPILRPAAHCQILTFLIPGQFPRLCDPFRFLFSIDVECRCTIVHLFLRSDLVSCDHLSVWIFGTVWPRT